MAGSGLVLSGCREIRKTHILTLSFDDGFRTSFSKLPKYMNGMDYSKNIPNARPLIILPGERGHYLTPALGAERASELFEVSQLAYSFFEEVLK